MSIEKLVYSCAVRLSLALFVTVTPILASGPAPDQPTANYEIRFLEGMIDHHTMAVHMAMMCLDKPVPQLTALCTNIKNTQSAEITQMQMWLQEWYSTTHTPEMSNGHMQQMDRMMEMSPTEFEREFLKSMIRHHWTAVIEAAGCVDRAYHEELRDMCEEIIIAQTAEIEQMRTILCDSYGLCNYGPKGSPRP
jgi:uncharacterized protein (DUF305 family)